MTIRLSGDEYRVNGDVVEVFTCTKNEYNHETEHLDVEYDWRPTKMAVGAEMTLVSRTNVSPNAIRGGYSKPFYYLHDGPISGNMNTNITRYHGWRGTSNDISIAAHGVRRIIKMRNLNNGDVSVTVSHDMHPEWD